MRGTEQFIVEGIIDNRLEIPASRFVKLRKVSEQPAAASINRFFIRNTLEYFFVETSRFCVPSI